jgi:hypothetical protein
MKYRTDRIEEEDGFFIGYTDWMGGPTISKVHAVCPDGNRRWCHVTGVPDTWFSMPAYCNNGKRGKVKGFLTKDNSVWQFIPYAYVDQHPIEWRPVAKVVPMKIHR